MKKDSNLFQEFNPVSSKEWKQQIQMELKGADYNKTLVWKSLEGIDVKPFYHADNYEFVTVPLSKEDFKISQRIFIDDLEIANKMALDSLSKGVEIIVFIAKESFDIDVLLQGFNELKKKPIVYFKMEFLSVAFMSSLLAFTDNFPLHIQFDVLGHLAKTGNWFQEEKNDFAKVAQMLTLYPKKQQLTVNASIYQNAGANSVQQVAYALAHATEYLNQNKEITSLQFEFAIGSNYFFEMAKLRAFRYLFEKLTAAYSKEVKLVVIAKPSLRNKTLYDYNVNMLRTATEYMSAILGGADVVETQAYDAIFKKSNDFSNHISRNQLLVLREENGFEAAQNFAKGSYFIESLTVEIAKKALDLFKEIEGQGGFLKALKSGKIQTKIQEAAQKEQDLFDKGEISLLGTNKYPNSEDKMKEKLELYPFLKINKTQTQIRPILAKRLAEKMEQERLELEN